MLKKGDKILFNKEKELIYIKPLGKGTYGETHLFHDTITDMYFAIKKCAPKIINQSAEEYRRFIAEVKILFNLSHPNIVRIYDYCLYPDERIGYLQMEYIKGTTIDEFICGAVRDWNDIFIETVYAFQCLEEHRVLHRDIRCCNIMIDETGKVKIIDFGHGKLLTPDEDRTTDIFPVWPVEDLPKEMREGIYTHQSDIYFLGLLFKSLPLDDNLSYPFLYHSVIETMTAIDPLDRYKSFSEVIATLSNTAQFTAREQEVYRRFTDTLCGAIDYYKTDFYLYEIDKIITGLSELLMVNMLEEHIYGSGALLDCFICGSYVLIDGARIKRNTVEDFYNMFANMTEERQRITIDNIKNRLYDKKVICKDGLPF